jgi:hypothetical protein
LTPDNLEAPWVNFESGALSKHAKDSAVWTLLLGGVQIDDIKGPLSQFQHTVFEKEDIFNLIKSINHAHGEAKQDETRLRTIFDKFWWTELEKKVNDASNLPEWGSELKHPRFALYADSTRITDGCTVDLSKTGTLALRITNLSTVTAECVCVSFSGFHWLETVDPGTSGNKPHGLISIPEEFFLDPSHVVAHKWSWLPNQPNELEDSVLHTYDRWLWRAEHFVTSYESCLADPIEILKNFPYSIIYATISVEAAGAKPEAYSVAILLNPEGRATPRVTIEREASSNMNRLKVVSTPE